MNKFTFDTVFARNGNAAADEPPSHGRKTYAAADIENIRAQAYAEGRRAGEVGALEQVAMATDRMASAVRLALSQSHAEIEHVRREASLFAIAVARKLAPAALSRLPTPDVEHALREAMHQAIGEPRILLRADPAVTAALAPHIEAIAHEEGFDGRVQIQADAAQHGADCRIEWRGGGAERSQAAIETALAEIVARRFSQNASAED